MSQKDTLGSVTVHRYMDNKHNAMLATGTFTALIAAFSEHANRWEAPLDGLTYTMMRQGLSGMVLHLSFRPNDENIGMTVNFKQPPINVFLSGDASESWVTGRAFVEGVKTTESSRLFMQTHRRKSGATQSMIEITGLDLLEVFEQYFKQSVQTPARFFELDKDQFAMILGLPNADRSWIENFTPDQKLFGIWKKTLEPLDQREFKFHCGCTPEKMVKAVHSIFGEDPDALFKGEDEVEVSCPRCGTRWTLTESQFNEFEQED
ncbi:MAG: hypothetical protein HKN21_05765 [Candidatus Eisenbacteria bacterium]|uniref:Disulfide bond chaperone n=1 Tax=Eiseniibacteriota bacterium TaxID=2212470 RepID=A0A7Y2H1R6_UNCEI|nr:hypothetical protein [Candidatus Eisenbacteria bacterium]